MRNLFHSTPTFSRLAACGVVALVAALSATSAKAQISFTLSNYSSAGTASSESYFSGTIMNSSTTTTYYLNNLQITQNTGTTPTSGVFTPDANPFINNAPATLAPGASYSGQIFGIQTSSSFNSSSHFNGTATLQGGTTDSTLATLGTPQSFVVYALPEPDAIGFVATGIIALGMPVVRRRRSA